MAALQQQQPIHRAARRRREAMGNLVGGIPAGAGR